MPINEQNLHRNLKFVVDAIFEKLKVELPNEIFIFNTAPIIYYDESGVISKEAQPYPAVHIYTANTDPTDGNQSILNGRQRIVCQTISIVCVNSADINSQAIYDLVGEVLQRIDGFQVQFSRQLILSSITHDIYIHGFHAEHLNFLTEFVLTYPN